MSATMQPPAKKPRKSRGRGLRTNTGCIVCRKRHMKCDELKPQCGPCAKGNRACEYAPGLANEHRPSDTAISPSHAVSPSVLPQAPQSTFTDNGPGEHTRFSPILPQDEIPQQPWSDGPADDILSPQSTSTGYGAEVAPLRWFGLLAGDITNETHDVSSLEALSDAALAQQGVSLQDYSTGQPTATLAPPFAFSNPAKLLQASALSPATHPESDGAVDERRYWQSLEPINIKDHELDIFERFVTGVSLWIDLFDPEKHFSSLIPHLALRNEGLMKALLALGARHLSIKPVNRDDPTVDRTAAVQYYYETLHYLQNAMRYTTYKNSRELLATVLTVSTYEMIDGAGKGWERHLKGVFWIQRSRDINGESGGLEQAIWWAWLRQDVWAAFREHRRCFSFFKPTKPYHVMTVWDMASRIVYILAQAVNYSSDEEKQAGETDLTTRILRGNTLLNQLDEWRCNVTAHFNPLPVGGPSNRAFKPLWIHPPAFGTSLQMFCMARILLLINQPAAGGYLEYQGRERIISECVDTIGGIAMKLTDDASRLMSTQCLFAAGLYCTTPAKQDCIAQLIRDHTAHTGWPANTDLAEELAVVWAKQRPG